MTYIEFFDKTASENICASLANAPTRVVLVGDKLKLLQKHTERYRELFRNRGFEVEFICRTINKNNMQNIIDELTYLVETYDDCVFDLTGGEDLYLVAVGMVVERHRDKNIQMHRFNIRNGTIIDCDQDGTTIMENDQLQMTIEENVRVYGGDIVYDDVKETGTHIWDMSDDFRDDILAMWNICKWDVRLWNTQIGVLEVADSISSSSEDELVIIVSVSTLTETLKRQGAKFVFIKGIINRLYDKGLILSYDYDEEYLSFTFKNEQVKKCLTKAGQVLEMLIYMTALDATDSSGNQTYNDVLNGVCIDWDGEIHTEEGVYDTENEIDVMMMHGIVPVFVSCKNGIVGIDELYKLNSVAEKFGGQYAKKVLVATALDSVTTFDEYFRQRAKDMGIRLVEGIQDMSASELNKSVRSFWSN